MLSASGIDLRQQLDQVLAALSRFNQALEQSACSGVLFNPISGERTEHGNEQELLHEAINDLNIPDDSTSGQVARYPGVFEVNEHVIEAALALNVTKKALAQLLKEFEKSGVTNHSLRQLYRCYGLARLHPLQACREINVLEGPIESIGFTKTSSIHSIERLSVGETITRLAERKAYDVIEKINTLPEHSELRWHTPVAPHIRANIAWRLNGERVGKMIHASLPFLVPKGSWPSKRVRFNQPRQHAKRCDSSSDTSIPLPFLKGAYLALAP